MSPYNQPEVQAQKRSWNGFLDVLPDASKLHEELQRDIEASSRPIYFFEGFEVPIEHDVEAMLLTQEALLHATSGENIHWISSYGNQLLEAARFPVAQRDHKRIEILKRTLRAYCARWRLGQRPIIEKIQKEMIERVEADIIVASGRWTRERADQVLRELGYPT